MSFSHMTTGSSWQEFQIIYLIAENEWQEFWRFLIFFLYILQRRQVFWMIHALPSKPVKRHSLTSNWQALYALELGGLKKKQTNKKSEILQFTFFTMAPVKPPELSLVKRASCVSSAWQASFTHCVYALYELSSLWVYLRVCTFLLYPYTTGDAVSDWGRTVVPKT